MKIRSHIFGWLTPHLAPVIRRDSEKLDLYLGLGRHDWHFMGLVVALMGDKAACPDHFAAVEAEMWKRARLNVLRDVFDGPARPLLKVTVKLTGELWRPASYLRLSNCVRDPAFLPSLRTKSAIDRRYIRVLSRVPSYLRHAAVLRRIKRTKDAEVVVFMVEAVRRIRTDLSDREILKSLSQSKGDLGKWVSHHYQSAPFPKVPWVGDDELTPVSNYPALKKLALEFDNCVRGYHQEVLSGQSYFYRYAPNGTPVATVELQHLPIVGWAMADVQGKNNAEVSNSVMTTLRRRFGLAGIGAMPDGTTSYDLFRAA